MMNFVKYINLIKHKNQLLKSKYNNFLKQSSQKISNIEKSLFGYLFQKYKKNFIFILALLVLPFMSQHLFKNSKKQTEAISADQLVPKGSVLVPIEIGNGKDIFNIIGEYGVVDLYTYSDETNLAHEQVASALKILAPDVEDGRFLALVPEKKVAVLFKYSDPFYAVIQNPKNKNTQIYNKKKKKSFIVIEENF